ncbi:unnamed protein product [Chironomus riparius]|uniref:Orn/DAP/Arg decarboxylase 2 N-terminal domain-containing protein n=1 Tax=Chironomus riparius TaxID=315576 RepID=A0A9P0IWU1_9DIPT|nr:unnamed protein product [Chironomus riparius]
MLNYKVDPKMIIYANTVKQVSHLKLAAEKGIQKVTFDCAAELEKIKKHHPTAEVVLRIRFDAATSTLSLGEKYGCNPVTEAPKLINLCKDMNMNLIGISFHVGTAATDCTVFEKALDAVGNLFDYAETINMRLKFIDIGGGFIGSDMKLFDKISESINSAIERNFQSNDIEFIAEPGRYFVDTAFSLAAQVILKRQSEDGKMFYFLNESYYMSFLIMLQINMKLEFSTIKLSKTLREATKKLSTIWGCTCSSLDKIIADIEMPEIDIGDWIVFHNMGAYTMSATTNFNGFCNKNLFMLNIE